VSSPVSARRETSTWFDDHAYLFHSGVRVLDLACGSGRHAIAAARLGGDVTAIDWSEQRLAIARQRAQDAGVDVSWGRLDLERGDIPNGAFDVVMVFNYLDRRRMADFANAVRPGGYLLYETFHVDQTHLGWGPTSPDHLLQPFELVSLVAPMEIVLYREVIETIDTQASALASVLARRNQ
jgi:tellurite methyltransferase